MDRSCKTFVKRENNLTLTRRIIYIDVWLMWFARKEWVLFWFELGSRNGRVNSQTNTGGMTKNIRTRTRTKQYRN